MERANNMLAEKGIVAKYIEFSPQKDPDEFLKAQGVLAMQEKIDNAAPAFDILLSKLLPEKLPEVLDRKLELLTKAFEALAPLKTHLAATERVVAFAKRLGLRSEASQIVKNYQDYLSTIEAKEKAVARFQVKPQVVSKATEDEIMPDEASLEGEFASVEFSEHKLQSHRANEPKKNLSKTEKLIVQELVQLPVLFSESALTELLDLVTSDEVKKYIEKIKKTILEIDESEYASVVLNLTSSPEYSSGLKEAASSALYNYRIKELDAKTKSRIFSDLKLKLQMAQLKTKKEELKKLQQICETDDEMTKILQELSEIEKKLQALKKNK
jgi:DNA primase